MTSKDDIIRHLKTLERKLDALEDQPDREVKVWMMGYHDCLTSVIALLGGETDEV